ncbi:MAG: hypothetical protein U0271_10955 [Polyangiaceae bacterium]
MTNADPSYTFPQAMNPATQPYAGYAAPRPAPRPKRTIFGIIGMLPALAAAVFVVLAARRLSLLLDVGDAEKEVKNWVGAIVYNGVLQRLRIYGIAGGFAALLSLPFSLVGLRSTVGKIALLLGLASLGSAIYVEYASKDMKYLNEDSFLEKNKRRHHD